MDRLRLSFMDNIEIIRQKLEKLRQEHQELNESIDAMVQEGGHDQLQLARLKKRKLGIKDQISILESRLIPDIIA